MSESKVLSRIKERWGISNNWQILIIFLVFGITGSTSVKIAAPILDYLGIHKTLNPWIYWPVRILAIFPVYQVLLLVIGTLFGQFRFFWNFEKKMFGRFFKSSSPNSGSADRINL
jgi:hypothetical protein